MHILSSRVRYTSYRRHKPYSSSLSDEQTDRRNFAKELKILEDSIGHEAPQRGFIIDSTLSKSRKRRRKNNTL
jgi:hypothetical protein